MSGAGSPPGIIAARFHNGLVALLSRTAEKVGVETGLERIALSGGVFQNVYLLERLERNSKRGVLRS